MNTNRRDFLKHAATLGTLAAFGGCASRQSGYRLGGASGAPMADFALKPMDEVRFGFIGLNRGSAGVKPFCLLPGTRVTAICDIDPAPIARTLKTIADCGAPKPKVYTGSEEAWKAMGDDPDIDFIIIGTPWLLHTPMAVYLMEHGKHVGVEVPAATTIEECWQLVETSERTRRICMQLENRCYNEIELMMANAIAQGAIGEVVYAECGYIHEIRELQIPRPEGDGRFVPWEGSGLRRPNGTLVNGLNWRGVYNKAHGGNAYPTHGIGPIAQILGVNRGDRFDYLVSVDSLSASPRQRAKEVYGTDSEEYRGAEFAMGDRNVSLIRTMKGRLVALSHNVVTPRPGNRLSLVEGTCGAFTVREGELAQMACDPKRGYWAKDNFRYSVNTMPLHHGTAWSSEEEGSRFAKLHEHPLWRDAKDLAKRMGGHGGQDFMMFLRMGYCLTHGLPVDQDVYDLAAWSSIVELSERSSADRGRSMDFPDFTRGAWKTRAYRSVETVSPEYLAKMQARAARGDKTGKFDGGVHDRFMHN